MLDFIARCFNLIRMGFLGIGFKKRIAFISIIVLVTLGVCLKPYFIANLADLQIKEEGDTVYNRDADQWDKWSLAMEGRGYRSIGDAFDSCDEKAKRQKIGKILVHFDRSLGTVVATVAANFTMPVSVGKGSSVRVISQFHGRTMYNQSYDLCKAKVETFGCPLSKGQKMHILETFKLPKYIPKGHYLSKAKVSNQRGKCFVVAESNFRI